MKVLSLLFLIGLTCYSQAFERSYEKNQKFGFNQALELHWTIDLNENTIHVGIKGKTSGWVGFGISPNGQMAGSDILFAGFQPNGNELFGDRFADDRAFPSLDTDNNGKDDWTKLSMKKDGEYLIVEGSRPLSASDSQYDSPIPSGPVKIIWAMGDQFGSTGTPLQHNLGNQEEVVEFYPTLSSPPVCDGSSVNQRAYASAGALTLKTFAGNIVVEPSQNNKHLVTVTELAHSNNALKGIKTVYTQGQVVSSVGSSSDSTPSNTDTPTSSGAVTHTPSSSPNNTPSTASATAVDTAVRTMAVTDSDGNTATDTNGKPVYEPVSTTNVVAGSTTNQDSSSTTMELISDANRSSIAFGLISIIATMFGLKNQNIKVLLVVLLMICVMKLNVVDAAVDCTAADHHARVTDNVQLTAETEKGDVLVHGVNAESVLLRTGDGSIHAKFEVDGVNFVVDTTGSRPNVMVKVEPKNNGKIKVIVKNFNGKYDATLRTNQQLTTIGDVTEYAQRPTDGRWFGMIDYGDDLLQIDTNGQSISIDLEAQFDVDPCVDDDCVSIEFRFESFKLSSGRTTYACWQWPLPDLLQNQNYHIVRIDPIIEHKNNNHHMLIGVTDTPLTSNGTSCGMGGDTIFGWAVGGPAFDMPSGVGLPLQGKQYVTIQMHYDNQLMESNIIDNSGMKFYLAPARAQSAGLLWLGSRLRDKIPAGQEEALAYGYCALPQGIPELNLFAHANHMHTRGRHEWTYMARSSKLVPGAPSNKMFVKTGDIDDRDKVFDFDRQEFTRLEPPVKVGFGDGFVTHCQYDTSQDTAPIGWGDETTDEMCISLLMYYPKVDKLQWCIAGEGIGEFNLP